MYKQLYVSHGSLCEGMLHTLKIFVGDACELQAIPFYVENIDAVARLSEFKEAIQPEDIVVIFTDIMMGSVNQEVVRQFSAFENVHIIAGFNLAIALEFAACNPLSINETFIKEKIESSMQSLTYMNTYQVVSCEQDE